MNGKTTVFCLLALFALVSAQNQNLSTSIQNITSPTFGAPMEIISGWQALAILAIFASIILVAMGYAIGVGFSIPELQAWAANEQTQVIANAVIIICMLAIATFLDIIVMEMVNGSHVGNLKCSVGENCLNKASQAYLQDYTGMARSQAKSTLHDSVMAGFWMNKRVGIYGNELFGFPPLQLGVSTTLTGQYMLEYDRAGLVFGYYQNLLGTMETQKFFLSEICFKIGPLLLAIGILARSFFFTRKIGGLLMAVAASIMVFFPAMYIFDWMSLDLAATGDQGADINADECPVECSATPPLVYYDDVQVSDLMAIYDMFTVEQEDQVRNLTLGRMEKLTNKAGKTVYSCEFAAGKSSPACSSICRELPYPITSAECANVSVQKACATLPKQCKVVRIVPKASINQTEYDSCPLECKSIPPLKSNCDVGKCLDSKPDCRAAMMNNLNWRPTMPKGLKGKDKCDWASQCPASNTSANESCVYVLPVLGSCDDICKGCPQECRLDMAFPARTLPPECYDDDGVTLAAACTTCPKSCLAEVSKLPTNCGGGWLKCPLYRRLIGDGLGIAYTSGSCAEEKCPYNSTYRAVIPTSTCEKCIYSEEPYEYNPPIRTDCASLCRPTSNAPSKSSADYTKIDEAGLVGTADAKGVSKLMVPAYLLPLLNIAMTLMLIRSLSGILGGDIEIPGLQRIF